MFRPYDMWGYLSIEKIHPLNALAGWLGLFELDLSQGFRTTQC